MSHSAEKKTFSDLAEKNVVVQDSKSRTPKETQLHLTENPVMPYTKWRQFKCVKLKL